MNIILMNQRHKENVILSEPTISNSGFRFSRDGQEDSFNCPPTWEVPIKQLISQILFDCFIVSPPV